MNRRLSHRAKHLLIVGVLWAGMSGCSQDGVSILCLVPVVEPSESMLGLVKPPPVDIAENGTSVTLDSNASTKALGYRLYIGTRSQSYQQVVDIGSLTTSVVSNLAVDMTYYFAVTAYNAAGECCSSNEVSAHIP